MASSSSIKHDVFISFRGEDIRTSFLSHLRKELHRDQIDFFVDDEKIHPGDEISSTLLQAIEESSISLVIFSENYASSTWCLNELVKVVQCMRQHQRVVIAVLYNVPPSDVRYQNNSFKKAFDEHQKKMERDIKVQSWRSALKEAAGLSGFHYQSKYQDESKFIEEIVKDISEKLSNIFSAESTVLVGIDDSIRSVELLLAIESSEVRIIGIWGMGGIGKTTLAEALFDKYSSQYEGSCMLKNVRDESQKFGMVYLCDKLESGLLAGEGRSSKAKSTLSRRKLSRKKVFVVLDDVDAFRKLKDFAIESFGSGSRIIVTTRDKHVLANVHDAYELKGLNFENSLKLFCLRAFGKVYPETQYEEVSKIAVNYATGIPLALEVLGSYLHSKTIQEWESALGKLKIYPNKEIFDVLKLSYEGLDELERNIFLDIVFFFKGKDKDVVIPFLESCEFFPADGIANLCRKALITISKNNEIEMHDLIEQTGREIVRQESIKDQGRRSRLSDPKDVYNVLNDNKGTESVEGIMLDMCQIKEDLQLDADTFKKMPDIRFLKFYDSWRNRKLGDVYFSSTPESFPKGLRYLQWSGWPLKSLPPKFCAEKLVELSMPWSKVSKLWDEVQDLTNLKRINLMGCEKLVELPDFTMATNLEEIDLGECVRLGELHPSILSIQKLKTLSVVGCRALQSLKSKIHLKSLQKLLAGSCLSMKEFSVSSEELTSLDLRATNIDKLNSSVGHLNKLIQLDLSYTRLRTLPNELCLLVSLEELDLEVCKELIELPPNMKALPRLNYLNIRYCYSLGSLPELPPSIICLFADKCTSLEKLFNAKGVFSLNLTYISFGKCKRLDVHSFAKYVLRTMIGVAIRDLLGEMLQYKSCGQVCYPGRKVPSWFKYHTSGSSVTVDLVADHPHYPQTLLGFILCCVVHHNHPDDFQRGHLKISCRSDLGCSIKYMPSDTINSNNVCIWFEEVRCDHGLRVSNVTFEFKDAYVEEFHGLGEWEVVRCGVCPVHASDILDILQNADPHFLFFCDRHECDRKEVDQLVFTLDQVKTRLIHKMEQQQKDPSLRPFYGICNMEEQEQEEEGRKKRKWNYVGDSIKIKESTPALE
ncbi:hypothetical protein PIB30_014945 [Stylosanthes scabra]|uniref:ADP-ribosyl cyclase/cyclic ADP-ribose hydrolase n=1 Tax=Stylosanthes scabra TaxID=79078 RepID=A0ABU6W6D9_9FABA|nr:hypothetical protein [Stylosanthes scabra]